MTTSKRPGLATLAAGMSLIAVGAASAQVAVPQQVPLRDAAVQLAHQYDENYGSKNAAGMAALYAPDGELVSPGGKLIQGRAALTTYYQQRFKSDAFDHKIIVQETRALRDTGYSIATFTVQAPIKGEPSKTHLEEGHIAAVYTHDETGWHFALVEPSVAPK